MISIYLLLLALLLTNHGTKAFVKTSLRRQHTSVKYVEHQQVISSTKSRSRSMPLSMAVDIVEFGGDDEESDEAKPQKRTHGYEGDFLPGDIVRVKADIRIWSVKAYMKEGFDVKGFEGKVKSLQLYGRKKGGLCSAITPVQVEFEPSGPGQVPGKSWCQVH